MLSLLRNDKKKLTNLEINKLKDMRQEINLMLWRLGLLDAIVERRIHGEWDDLNDERNARAHLKFIVNTIYGMGKEARQILGIEEEVDKS